MFLFFHALFVVFLVFLAHIAIHIHCLFSCAIFLVLIFLTLVLMLLFHPLLTFPLSFSSFLYIFLLSVLSFAHFPPVFALPFPGDLSAVRSPQLATQRRRAGQARTRALQSAGRVGTVMATSVFVARLREAKGWTGHMHFANNLRLLLAIKIDFIISICLSAELKS
jgi:hypothetical protein